MKTNNKTEVIIMGLSILVVLLPLVYGVVHAATNGTVDGEAFLEKPDPKHKECIKDTEYMRSNHMDLLNMSRDGTVREGKKPQVKLNDCWECHTSKERFCDRCHVAVSLRLKCFTCHYAPKETGESRGQ
jgi:hypothetical protein